jgi:cyclin-dependent kinase 7
VPFLPGDTDLDQLSRIFQVTGTPNQENWPKLKDLPDYVDFKFQPKQPLETIFSAASPDIIHLLETCLTLDPQRRCSATEALQMHLFKNKPYATPYHLLPLPGGKKNVLKRKADESGDMACAKQLCF